MMEKKFVESELMVGGGGELGASWMRLWQAVRRTEGEATTFWRRLENLPWWY